MTRLTGRSTVSWLDLLWILSIRTYHSLYFSWQYIRVDTVDSAPEDPHGILAFTVLFIDIYTV